MIVKKFQAPTETEAVLAAKQELGGNAVVMNVKTLKQRGIFRLFKKDMVEITAALEEKEFVKEEPRKSFRREDEFLEEETPPAQEREKAAIEQKLDSLHILLQNQMAKESKEAEAAERVPADKEDEHGTDNKKQPDNGNFKFLQLIYNQLIENEVDEKYANMIIGEIENSIKKESNIDSLLAGVYQKIILKLGEPKTIDIGGKPKVVFFIGPTGVGKTTTIAKLASKYKLEEKVQVAFITADTYRIAAVEQLNTYASIIDCPVSVIYDCDEMEECLKNYQKYDLIMVDTAGRSHKSDEQILEVVDLIHRVKAMEDKFDVEIYLTLSITTKYRDLVKITEAYKDIEDYRVLFTKLDETCALGNILNVKLLTEAPLSYTTSGQNVPTDIEVINEQGLAKLLLGGND